MDWRVVLQDSALSTAQLRETFRTALLESSAIRDAVNVAEEPLVLDAYTSGGNTIRVDLTRLYDDVVRSESAARTRRFEDHLAATLEAARTADHREAPARDQLVPTIKSVAWATAFPVPGLAAAGFVGDLAVVFAFDRKSTITYASLADLEALGVTITDAQAISLENLRNRLPRELSTRGDGQSFVFTAGGNIEASLILLPEIWDGLATQLPGDIIACVLARDVCLVTATEISGGLASLRAARDRIVAGMTPSELISTTLLVRRRGVWAVMESN